MLITIVIGLASVVDTLRNRRRRKPAPKPPTKPFQGRLPLPPVDIRPYRTLRSIDEGEVWPGTVDENHEDDNVLYFDPSKRASYIHRRLEVVRKQNEAN
jgi:hypothetical protein